MFNLSESMLPEYDVFGRGAPARRGALPASRPSNAYRCADGLSVLVAGNGDSIFKRLMVLIERPTWPTIRHWPATTAQSLRAEEL